MVANRDGGLETMEVTGMLSLRITDENMAKIRMQLHNTPNKAIQLQTHPNIDKELLKTRWGDLFFGLTVLRCWLVY